MTFKRTVIALAVGLSLSYGSAQATPPLSLNKGLSAAQVKTVNSWVEINKAAFEHNISTLQAELQGKSKLCAVLKADAYGHGLANVMPSIIAMGVPCIAIANNDEIRVARASGFKGEIVRIRLASQSEIADAFKYDVEELIGNAEQARQAGELAAKHGRQLKVHIALNAGTMSRNDFEMKTEQGRADAVAAATNKHLKVVAIMTHYAVEDSDKVRLQLALFNEQSAWLMDTAKLDRKKITLHTANSFTTLEVPEARLDMVRPGGALFGDTVTTRTEYKRVMKFKSRVAAVNTYPAGNTVGYDQTYTLQRESKLANITVGYADGYRRVFTNKGFVLIDGHRAPVVGKVSMNTLMVDVTDFPDVTSGDEVVLFGKQGNAEISQAETEDINGALLADLYTIWGSSNPKYVVNDKAGL